MQMMFVMLYNHRLLANKYTELDFTRRGQKYPLPLTCDILQEAGHFVRLDYLDHYLDFI